jgi:hypothetical protein
VNIDAWTGSVHGAGATACSTTVAVSANASIAGVVGRS